MRFWRSHQQDVETGQLYRRRRESRVTETAEVVSVIQDRVGIPHVRYRVSFARPERHEIPAEYRTLALSVFTELYRERILA